MSADTEDERPFVAEMRVAVKLMAADASDVTEKLGSPFEWEDWDIVEVLSVSPAAERS